MTTTELIKIADETIDAAQYQYGVGLITHDEYSAMLEESKEYFDAVAYVDEHHSVFKVARRYYDELMVPPVADAEEN